MEEMETEDALLPRWLLPRDALNLDGDKNQMQC